MGPGRSLSLSCLVLAPLAFLLITPLAHSPDVKELHLFLAQNVNFADNTVELFQIIFFFFFGLLFVCSYFSLNCFLWDVAEVQLSCRFVFCSPLFLSAENDRISNHIFFLFPLSWREITLYGLPLSTYTVYLYSTLTCLESRSRMLRL